MTTWVRVPNNAKFYDRGWFLQAAIAPGLTYRRIRWSWGFTGTTSDTADMNAVTENYQIVGLVTTIGDGTEVPPSPRTSSGDAAPPTERWLWWEQRQPVAIAIDHAAGVVSWRDSGAQEVPDVKSAVLATGIPGGDSLNLWFSWESTLGAWDSTGQQQIWVATSVLVS